MSTSICPTLVLRCVLQERGVIKLRCNPLDKKEGMLKQHWYPFLAFKLWKERFPGIWNFPRSGRLGEENGWGADPSQENLPL